MSKKILFFIAIISLSFTSFAFAAVENIKISGDITAQGIARDLNMGAGDLTDGMDTYYHRKQEQFGLSQVRLKFDADLTENVSAVVQLLSERLWGQQDWYNDNTQIDLSLAYVEMKEFFHKSLTLVIGRQNLYYGNGLIIGDPTTNQVDPGYFAPAGDLSLRKSFDAAKAIIDLSPFVIDLVYASVYQRGNGAGTTDRNDDVDLVGTNIAYQWGTLNGLSEGYFFTTVNSPADAGVDTTKSIINTVGTRLQFDPIEHLTLGGEIAYQFGKDNQDAGTDVQRSAWAAQVMGEYKFLNSYNARIGSSYSYFSGDKNTDDKKNKAWDPLFEDQTPAEIVNILCSNSNAHVLRAYGSFMPREDITLGALYCWVRMAEKVDSDYYVTPDGGPTNFGDSSTTGTIVYNVDPDKRHFGDEVDLWGAYDYTEDVQFKLIGALFVPGSYFTKENNENAYSVRGSVKVSF